MLANLSVSLLVTVFPPRRFILYNSRSAIRSRSRSPQQVNIADAVVSANTRNFASLTRRHLSRSDTFAARPLVFVNIEISRVLLDFLFAGEVMGRIPPPPPSEKNYGLRPLLSRQILWKVQLATLICFDLRCYLNNLSEASPFPR